MSSVLSACGDDGSDPGAGLEHDFVFVPYQGIGDPESDDEVRFSNLFDDGLPVILNFWAGQCPPCRAEMPDFQRVADEFDGQIILFGVDVGVFTMLGSRDDARELLDELDITYPAGYAVDSQPLRDYNVTAMPTTIFFTADGDIHFRRAGIILEDEMRQRVQEVIEAS